MSGADLAVIVPLWRRTKNLDRLLGSAWATVPDAELVFVLSPDDDDACGWFGRFYGGGGVRPMIVDWPGGSPGDYARKINAGYRASNRPLLFTGADDIEFTPGWYEAARALIDVPRPSIQLLSDGHSTLSGSFEIPRIGVVGTNDLANPRVMRGEHSTHSLVARWYADQGCSVDQGAMIYHEGYAHEYCDDELVQTAMVRQAWAFAPDAVVRHHHPINPALGVPDDETYQRGRAQSRQSRALYRRRQPLWRPYG